MRALEFLTNNTYFIDKFCHDVTEYFPDTNKNVYSVLTDDLYNTAFLSPGSYSVTIKGKDYSKITIVPKNLCDECLNNSFLFNPKEVKLCKKHFKLFFALKKLEKES